MYEDVTLVLLLFRLNPASIRLASALASPRDPRRPAQAWPHAASTRSASIREKALTRLGDGGIL
jgi:hypothetical protein